MSVIVKGMDMPINCFRCRFLHRYDARNGYCGLINSPYFDERNRIPCTAIGRPDWCPLVELPNTDLVDADTIEFWGETEHGYRWTGKIVVHREKETDNE